MSNLLSSQDNRSIRHDSAGDQARRALAARCDRRRLRQRPPFERTGAEHLDARNFSLSQCAPVTAFGLKVIPPGETTSAGVPFSFRACSKAGPVFLTVRPVQTGVGVPGYPNL